MDKHLKPYNLSEKFIKSHNNNINDYVMKIITILMILIIIIVIYNNQPNSYTEGQGGIK